jgi:hypothetical protein
MPGCKAHGHYAVGVGERRLLSDSEEGTGDVLFRLVCVSVCAYY